VRELSLFGSALRADFGPASDVDFLVAFHDGVVWGFDQLDDMTSEAEAIIGRRVDVVSARALRNPFLRADVMSSHRVLYTA
jgi:hypothetical protein